jgi:hypothetical protein
MPIDYPGQNRKIMTEERTAVAVIGSADRPQVLFDKSQNAIVKEQLRGHISSESKKDNNPPENPKSGKAASYDRDGPDK